MEVKIDDYVEGTEHYGDTTRKVCGWVDLIQRLPDRTNIFIQADDGFNGHRGTIISSKLGEITVLEYRERIELLPPYLGRR